MVVINATKNSILADRCRFANSVLKRMVGLLNRHALSDGEALLLDHCYGIHTFGMRFPIDVLCLDNNFRVLRTIAGLSPFRACVLNKAAFIMELPSGTLKKTQTALGDQIHIRVDSDSVVPSANGLDNVFPRS
jgi:hypothetical protein